jgi:hypothetical protein
MLYEQNLVSDSEVNARMNEYVLAVSRDGARPDSVLPAFHQWLEVWSRAHPDRVKRASLVPSPYRNTPQAGADD